MSATGSSRYRLLYFDMRGRAEVARYLFALAGVQYEDRRLSREAWPEEKAKTPFGRLPVLVVDGVEICQSEAIYRFLAREFGYYGSTSLDGALIDALLGCFADSGKELMNVAFLTKEEDKAEAKRKFIEGELPRLIVYVERQLGDNDWLVGGKLSLADVYFYHYFNDYVSAVLGRDSWASHPKLAALSDRVKALPAIRSWETARPSTPY